MNIIKNKKVLAIVGILGLILGILLPYYNVSILGYFESISLWNYLEGKIILLLVLILGLIIFKDIIEKYLPQVFNNGIGRIIEKVNNPKLVLIPIALIAIYAIYLLIKLDISSEYVKYGLGFYILWIGIIALVGYAIFYRNGSALQQNQSMNYQQNVPQQNQSMNYQQNIPQQNQSMNYQQNVPQQNQSMNYQQNVPQQNQSINIQQNIPQQNQTMDYQRNIQQQTGLNKKYCPICNNQVDVLAQTCFMCGNKF